MLVSCAVPLETRRSELCPRFLRLLVDEEYWVRAMAYQVLGAFIATFADPPVAGMAYDPYGELVFVGPEGFEFRWVFILTLLNSYPACKPNFRKMA